MSSIKDSAKALTIRHEFEKTDVPVSKSCVVCASIMLGFGKQAYQCTKCGEAVHKKCLRKGLDGLCSKKENEVTAAFVPMSQNEVMQLQQSVFSLQRNLFQQQVQLDKKIKEFEEEKAKFDNCKKWIATMLPEDLRQYVDKIEEIVLAQRIVRTQMKAKGSAQGKGFDLGASRLGSVVEEYRHSVAAEDSRRRYQAFLEIITTERQYNKALSDLRTYFLLPLREEAVYAKRPIITNKEMETLLVLEHMEVVTAISEEVLSSLETAYKSNSFDSFGAAFLPFLKRFEEPYLGYLIGYDKSNALLQDLKDNNREFCILLKKCETSIPGATFGTSLNLSSYLIQPCQRLPRYQMLFKALLEMSPKDHKDYNNLSAVVNAMSKIVADVNEQKAEYEDQERLTNLQPLIPEYAVVKPGRRVVKEGQLVGFSLPGADMEGKEKLFVILCNDICVFAPRIRKGGAAKKQDTVRLLLPLRTLAKATEAARDGSDDAWAQDSEGEIVGFRVTSVCGSELRLVAPDVQQVQQWIRALNGAIGKAAAEEAEARKSSGPPQSKLQLQKISSQYELGKAVVDINLKSISFNGPPPVAPKPQTGVNAVAIYSLDSKDDGNAAQKHLSFRPGVVICDIEAKEGREWWFGRLAGTESKKLPFPKKYVRELPAANTNPITHVPLRDSGSLAGPPSPITRAAPPPPSTGAAVPPPLPQRKGTDGPPLPARRGTVGAPPLPQRGDAGGASRPAPASPAPPGLTGSTLSRQATVDVRSGLTVQVLYRDQGHVCTPKTPVAGSSGPGSSVPLNENVQFSNLAAKSQVLILLIDAAKNATLDFCYFPISRLVVGVPNKGVKIPFKSVSGTLEIDICLNVGSSASLSPIPAGPSSSSTLAAFHNFLDTPIPFTSWCEACKKIIPVNSTTVKCQKCWKFAHSGCKGAPCNGDVCITATDPSEFTATVRKEKETRPEGSRIGGSAPNNVVVDMIDFDSLLSSMPTEREENYENMVPMGLKKRLETVFAEFQVSLAGAVQVYSLKSMIRAVKLPRKTDLCEWMAVNVIQCYKAINQMYLIVAHECTEKSCPEMSASPTIVYKWADGKKVVQAQDVSAPMYVQYLKEWVEEQFRDPQIFPGSGSFKKKYFHPAAKVILKKLYRVVCHVYFRHYSTVRLRASNAFKIAFAYVHCFQQEYKLLDKKADITTLAPMETFIKSL